jgi:hypothetical protein
MKRDLVKSAQMRSSVIELLNQIPPEPRSMAGLIMELRIAPEEVKAFNSLVYRMADNGLIKGHSTEEHGKLYGAKDWNPDAVDPLTERRAPSTKRAYNKASPAKVLDMLADLTVDISKSTGRIRLTTNGMTIDIGVIA